MAQGDIRSALKGAAAATALTIVSLTIFNPIAMASVVLPDCAFEDSTWCVWDAQREGNGYGQGFISFHEGAWVTAGPAFYPEGADAGYETEWDQ